MSYEKAIRENKKMMDTFNYYTKIYYDKSLLCKVMEYEDYRQEQEIALYKRYKKYYKDDNWNLRTLIIKSIKGTTADMCRVAYKEKNYLNNKYSKISLDGTSLDGGENSYPLTDVIKGDEDVKCSIEFIINELGVEFDLIEKRIIYLIALGYKTREIDKILNFKGQTTKNKLRKIRKKLTKYKEVFVSI